VGSEERGVRIELGEERKVGEGQWLCRFTCRRKDGLLGNNRLYR